ncbi:hypothetical protein [Paenibacillus sp. NPDC057967]|uniref:hypothetical protein n=1 Tax=Paenibacillus sp. NPDC057967 TaxID=3346293 RepID=UPI0036D8C37A
MFSAIAVWVISPSALIVAPFVIYFLVPKARRFIFLFMVFIYTPLFITALYFLAKWFGKYATVPLIFIAGMLMMKLADWIDKKRDKEVKSD